MERIVYEVRRMFVKYNYFCFTFVFILLFPLLYFFSRKPSRYLILSSVRKAWAVVGCALSGIFFHIEYREKPDKKKTYILVANHCSYLDTLAMSQVAQGRFHYMGKIELVKNPVLRIFFKTIDIAFDRNNHQSAYEAYKQAGRNLENGMSLVIFPEGGITGTPPAMRQFKNGAFKLAIEQRVPIIPVTILNTWDLFYAEGQRGARPGILRCFVHKAVTVDQYAIGDDVDLRNKVQTMINDKLNEYLVTYEKGIHQEAL